MQSYGFIVFVLILLELFFIILSYTWILKPSIVAESSVNSTIHVISKLHNYNYKSQPAHKIKIGLVKPTFTDAAYNNKFYLFYNKNSKATFNTNITKNLLLLNSKVSNIQRGSIHNVFALSHLVKDIGGISNKTQSYILSDVDVDKGNIFFNGSNQKSNLFDILVLGHQEYVTQKEYNNFKQFVKDGGTMILLDGNIFYAEVKYYDKNNTISLVKGHGWAYNGKTAWRSVSERWQNETKEWIGSNYLCYLCVKSFRNNPFGYLPHEEQYVTNPNDTILFNFEPVELPTSPNSNASIDMYSLNYGKGKVISFGIYSDDVIQNKYFNSFFTNLIESDIK